MIARTPSSGGHIFFQKGAWTITRGRAKIPTVIKKSNIKMPRELLARIDIENNTPSYRNSVKLVISGLASNSIISLVAGVAIHYGQHLDDEYTNTNRHGTWIRLPSIAHNVRASVGTRAALLQYAANSYRCVIVDAHAQYDNPPHHRREIYDTFLIRQSANIVARSNFVCLNLGEMQQASYESVDALCTAVEDQDCVVGYMFVELPSSSGIWRNLKQRFRKALQVNRRKPRHQLIISDPSVKTLLRHGCQSWWDLKDRWNDSVYLRDANTYRRSLEKMLGKQLFYDDMHLTLHPPVISETARRFLVGHVVSMAGVKWVVTNILTNSTQIQISRRDEANKVVSEIVSVHAHKIQIQNQPGMHVYVELFDDEFQSIILRETAEGHIPSCYTSKTVCMHPTLPKTVHVRPSKHGNGIFATVALAQGTQILRDESVSALQINVDALAALILLVTRVQPNHPWSRLCSDRQPGQKSKLINNNGVMFTIDRKPVGVQEFEHARSQLASNLFSDLQYTIDGTTQALNPSKHRVFLQCLATGFNHSRTANVRWHRDTSDHLVLTTSRSVRKNKELTLFYGDNRQF